MFGSYRNLDRYIESLRRLLDMSDRIRLILPSHHSLPIGPEWIGRDLEDAISLREGRLADIREENGHISHKPCAGQTPTGRMHAAPANRHERSVSPQTTCPPADDRGPLQALRRLGSRALARGLFSVFRSLFS